MIGQKTEYIFRQRPDLWKAASAVRAWWIGSDASERLGGAPACMFMLRAALEGAQDNPTNSDEVARELAQLPPDVLTTVLVTLLEDVGRANALLQECGATLRMWSDVAPAVSLIGDIDKLLGRK